LKRMLLRRRKAGGRRGVGTADGFTPSGRV
jgi:hypothetical protein